MKYKKKRLYIALYPSGVRSNEERKYHWGFLIGPKETKDTAAPGLRCHVKNPPVEGWRYEEEELPDVRVMINLLARIVIGKIKDEKRLINILRSVPVVQKDTSWRCRTWLVNTLAAIEADSKAVGTSILDWPTIEPKARDYVAQKTNEGRYQNDAAVLQPKPTWDMLENKETIP